MLGVAPDEVDFEGLVTPIIRGNYINDMLKESNGDDDFEEVQDAYLPVTPREAAAFDRVVQILIKYGGINDNGPGPNEDSNSFSPL